MLSKIDRLPWSCLWIRIFSSSHDRNKTQFQNYSYQQLAILVMTSHLAGVFCASSLNRKKPSQNWWNHEMPNLPSVIIPKIFQVSSPKSPTGWSQIWGENRWHFLGWSFGFFESRQVKVFGSKDVMFFSKGFFKIVTSASAHPRPTSKHLTRSFTPKTYLKHQTSGGMTGCLGPLKVMCFVRSFFKKSFWPREKQTNRACA